MENESEHRSIARWFVGMQPELGAITFRLDVFSVPPSTIEVGRAYYLTPADTRRLCEQLLEQCERLEAHAAFPRPTQ